MKSINLSRLLSLILLLAVVVLASSCNRGYGCPNNFSLDSLADVLHSLAGALP